MKRGKGYAISNPNKTNDNLISEHCQFQIVGSFLLMRTGVYIFYVVIEIQFERNPSDQYPIYSKSKMFLLEKNVKYLIFLAVS